MGRLAAASCLLLYCAAPVAAADDPLARARALYNQRQFDAALAAAEQARLAPTRADAADLVGARAYLERFRASEDTEDLTNARERLRRLDPRKLSVRERLEYIVGLGEALFFDGAFGAAASVFDSVLLSSDSLAPGGSGELDARERVLDWWATAVGREATPRSDIDRQTSYQRMRVRMDEELASRPASTTAAYWLAAAARAQG